MVVVCDASYPEDKQTHYGRFFEKYPFPLSSFQKHALKAIVTDHHVLVTAHTGSGKTLPAEFAIEHWVAQGKKLIYTSPIKALSNQKFHEFSQKFPHISFGLLTGDIKTNPEADVLIMTTEILLSKLYSLQTPLTAAPSFQMDVQTPLTAAPSFQMDVQTPLTAAPSFQMDVHTELACVIFDEIHYINDAARGKVWEETIMLLPPHVQMVMLSATMDAPSKFAAWIESQHVASSKQVFVASTHERVVPLTHYAYLTCTQSVYKANKKNKELCDFVKRTSNQLHVLQTSGGELQRDTLRSVAKLRRVLKESEVVVSRAHVLNSVCAHLVEANMLPALCFVFNRKQLEQCAQDVTTVLLEDDSKVPYLVRKECEQILRKLPNVEEYLRLPEYHQMVALLEKGIAVHHAGIMPVLREMVELLFNKGYVKLLFATETFAVGINMPTKSVLFTSLSKYDGRTTRHLLPHEYTQMAGRAGRRGIDVVGHVVHLANLYPDEDFPVATLGGLPQPLKSQFRVTYPLVFHALTALAAANTHADVEASIVRYAERSLVHLEQADEVQGLILQIHALRASPPLALVTDPQQLDAYTTLVALRETQKQRCTNKQRKQTETQLRELLTANPCLSDPALLPLLGRAWEAQQDLRRLQDLLTERQSNTQLQASVRDALALLTTHGFVSFSSTDTEPPKLTALGNMAFQLRETHCLVMAELLADGTLRSLAPPLLVSVFSCFTSVTVPERLQNEWPPSELLASIEKRLAHYQTLESNRDLSAGSEYSLQYDLYEYMPEWCACSTEQACKELLDTMSREKDLFLGEFVKAILKINTIALEFERLAEQQNDLAFLSALKQIPTLTLKFVATNQSLYV